MPRRITGTENKISYARQSYNNAVMDYNVGIQKFPNNIIAVTISRTKFFSRDENPQSS